MIHPKNTSNYFGLSYVMKKKLISIEPTRKIEKKSTEIVIIPRLFRLSITEHE